ncbi:MAG: ankyrin repeat domain-containing protein [Candidatus Scalindua sediminis]|nr:ankyrin repeat domain-containing protein [Candidatus Scalindua sediminis]
MTLLISRIILTAIILGIGFFALQKVWTKKVDLIALLKGPSKAIPIQEEETQDINVAGGKVFGDKNVYQEQKPDASSSFQDRLLFMAAAEEGNVSAIESLLDKGVGVNTIDRDGYTALIWAAVYGQRACVQKLIEKGSKVDVKNSIGWTALISASHNGHKAIVELLIENGADVNVKANDGNTALTFASAGAYDEIVDILKKSGAVSVKYQDDKILTAALKGDVNTLKALLEKGVSPNTISRIGGETPLMYATGKNHIECAKLLLRYGADANIEADDGHTVFDDIKDKPEMLKLIESNKSIVLNPNDTFIVFNPNVFPPAILKSQNISGTFTDNGVLDFTFTFDEPLENEHYMVKTAETASFEYKLYSRTRNSFSVKFEEPCPDLVKLEFVLVK